MMPSSISAYAPVGSFNGVTLPQVQPPNLATPATLNPLDVENALQQNQAAANAQNQSLYQQALSTETNAYNSQQSDIQAAIQAQQGYGQSQITQLGTQLQGQLGANTQSNVSRGLSNTTLNQTSQVPILNNYNQAVAGVNNQSANLMNGLYSNLASSQASGANSLANLIASRNDLAPNASQFANLNMQANSSPGMIGGSTFAQPGGGGLGGMSAPAPQASGSRSASAAPAGSPGSPGGQFNNATQGELPNTSDSGGGQSLTSGGAYNPVGQYNPLSTNPYGPTPPPVQMGSGSNYDGYDAGMLSGDTSGGNMALGGDTSGGDTTPLNQLGFAPGSNTLPGAAPQASNAVPDLNTLMNTPVNAPNTPPDQLQAPAAPQSISSAMQPQQMAPQGGAANNFQYALNPTFFWG